MSFVRTRVDGNPVSTETLSIDRCLDHVGIVSSSGIAERRELVDINGKPGHDAVGNKFKILFNRQPGFLERDMAYIFSIQQ